jgi:tetratricopeptide (TPR) repeat protein
MPGFCLLARAQQPAAPTREIDRLAQQAEAELHQQEPAEAAAEYRKILILDPKNVSAHSNLGLAYYLQGQYPQAAGEFQIALRSKPDLWNIVALCGLAEAQTGQNAEAIAHLDQALQQVREPSLRMTAGRQLYSLLMQAGDLNRAASVIGEMEQLDPNNADVLYAAHQVYALLANQAFLSLAQAAPDSARMYELQGDEMAQVGNIPGAIAAYRHAVELDPHLSGVHYALGAALSASHSATDQTGAEAEYQKALADNPQDERAQCSLGNIELKRSNWQAASIDFKRALQLEPADPEANKGMGIVLMSEGSNAEAVSYLKRAVWADPLDESAYYHLSLASRNAGDVDAAARAMQEFQKLKTRKDELADNFRNLRQSSTPSTSGSQTASPQDGPVKPPDEN